MQKEYKLSESEYRDLLNSFVEVKLNDPSNFLKVMETLTRIGIPGRKGNNQTLYQSCHILHKNNPDRYYIVHFKEMFKLDGKSTDFAASDRVRRNRIVKLLQDFDLLTPVKELTEQDLKYEDGFVTIKVLKHAEKEDWLLEPKYTIGAKKKREKEDE